jgi:NADPH:quinone reductase-like Zn-dependent oxidoreductase
MVPPGFPDVPYVPGWDLAGVVTGAAPGLEDWVGRRVFGMIPWYDIRGAVGAYSEVVAVDVGWIVPTPDGLSDADAATIPVNGQTAVQLLELLDLPGPSDLLVTGASGAVGSFLVQLAVAAGHRVTAVAGADDEEWVRSLGAAVTLPRDADYAAIGEFRFVADVVPLGRRLLPSVAEGAVVVTTRPPRPVEPPRDIEFRVVALRSQAAVMSSLAEQLGSGQMRTRVSRMFPLDEVAEAHRTAEAGHLKGKVLICP